MAWKNSKAVKRLWGRLPPIVTHSLTLLSGTSIAQLIPALVAPALTRLYRPEDFGLFAIVYALLAVFSAISCLRYELSIVLPQDENEALHLLLSCLGICAGTAIFAELCCIAMLMLFPGTPAARFAVPIMAMVPIGILFMGGQQVAQMWCVRTHAFKVSATAMIAQAAVTAVAQIGLAAIWGSNAYFLIIGMQAGLVAAAAVYVRYLWPRIGHLVLQNFSFARLHTLLGRYSRFPLYTAPYVFVTQASARGNLWILASLTVTATAGQFALAQRVIFLPISTVMASASQIFFSRASRLIGDPQLYAAVERVLGAVPLLAVPPFLLMFLFAEPLFLFLFGPAWSEAGRFASALAIPSLLIMSTAWMDRFYDILGRQRLALVLEIFNNAVSLTLVFLVLHLTRDAVLAVKAYAGATAIYYVLWTYFTLRIAGLSPRILMKSLAAGAVVALVIAGANEIVSSFSDSSLLRFLLMLFVSLPIMATGGALGLYGPSFGATFGKVRTALAAWRATST